VSGWSVKVITRLPFIYGRPIALGICLFLLIPILFDTPSGLQWAHIQGFFDSDSSSAPIVDAHLTSIFNNKENLLFYGFILIDNYTLIK